MSDAKGKPDVLAGGRWVHIKGGVKVWEPVQSRAPQLNLPLLPQSTTHDPSQLFACTSCDAKVTEACRSVTGERVKSGAHAGRLAPRLCPCGAQPVTFGRECPTCYRRERKRLSQLKRRAIARAIERERAA